MDKHEMQIRLIEALLRNDPTKTAKAAAKDAKKAFEIIVKG